MDSRIRFLQCAGCLFDSPAWEGPEGWVEQRNQDLWQTFDEVLQLCQSEKVELLFLTGNLFEQEYVRKSTVERIARSLGTLTDTKIFIAPGERDPFVTTSAYRFAVWPSNVHIFSSGVSNVKIPSLNVTIFGVGWTAYQQEGSFLDGFQVTGDGTTPIMLLHAEVAPLKNTGGIISLKTEHIALSGLAYLALGHREKWSGMQYAGKTVWADSGVLEPRSFGENGPHGVIIGEIGPDSKRLEFRELRQRHYIEKTFVTQSNIESIATKLLSETGPEERQKDLFRVKLSGPSPNPETEADALQRLLADKFRFIEIIHTEGEMPSQYGTNNVTSSITSSGDGSGYSTLTHIFIQKLKEHQDNAASTEDYEHWNLVKKIGLAALEQGRIDDEN